MVSFGQTSIYVQSHKAVAEILILKSRRRLSESEVRPTLTTSLSELTLLAALRLHPLLVQEIFHLHVAALPPFLNLFSTSSFFGALSLDTSSETGSNKRDIFIGSEV